MKYLTMLRSLLMVLSGCTFAPPQTRSALKAAARSYDRVQLGTERGRVYDLLGEPTFGGGLSEKGDDTWITGSIFGFPRFYVLIETKYGPDRRVVKIHREERLHTPLFHPVLEGASYL
jgi:hypothetical protein